MYLACQATAGPSMPYRGDSPQGCCCVQLRVHAPPQHQQTEWECAAELFDDLGTYLTETGWQVRHRG